VNAQTRRPQHQRGGAESTYTELLQSLVRSHAADLGLALDGDADRVVAVDEQGELVDGDQIMVMTALDWHARGILRNDAIAVHGDVETSGSGAALTAAGVGHRSRRRSVTGT